MRISSLRGLAEGVGRKRRRRVAVTSCVIASSVRWWSTSLPKPDHRSGVIRRSICTLSRAFSSSYARPPGVCQFRNRTGRLRTGGMFRCDGAIPADLPTYGAPVRQDARCTARDP
jgi:hypothetical protein